MADWQSKIDLTTVWSTEDPKIIAAEAAKQLRALDLSFLPKDDVMREVPAELAEEFEVLAEQEAPDKDDFDDVMEGLYQWADTSLGGRKKVCWVATVLGGVAA